MPPPAAELAAAHADYADVLAEMRVRLPANAPRAEEHYQEATRLAPGVVRYWLKLGEAREYRATRYYADRTAALTAASGCRPSAAYASAAAVRAAVRSA